MELENTNAAMEPDQAAEPLSEPHFEDEATLLSARPVVPLDEVEPARSRLTRGWLLAATIFGAMFLGALGSAVYLSIVNREPAASALESEALTGGVVGEVADSPRTNQPAASEANAQVIPDSDQEIPDSEQTKETNDDRRKPAARRVDVLTYPASREERKAARRLAKEQKRELERQDRRARDLTRIREIFEGTQRPQ